MSGERCPGRCLLLDLEAARQEIIALRMGATRAGFKLSTERNVFSEADAQKLRNLGFDLAHIPAIPGSPNATAGGLLLPAWRIGDSEVEVLLDGYALMALAAAWDGRIEVNFAERSVMLLG